MTKKRQKLKRRIRQLNHQVEQLRNAKEKCKQKTLGSLTLPSQVTEAADLDRAYSIDVTRFEDEENFEKSINQLVMIEICLTNMRVLLEWFDQLAPQGQRYGADPDDLLRYSMAKAFVLEVWTISQAAKQLGQLCPQTAPDIAEKQRAFENSLPELKRVRNSISHVDERLSRVGRLGDDPDEMEGRITIGRIVEGKITYSDDSGEAQVEISRSMLEKAEQFVAQIYGDLPRM